MTRHQYGNSAPVSQTSFHRETSGGVVKMSAVFSDKDSHTEDEL